MSIIAFDLPEKSDLAIRNSLLAFLKRPRDYKNKYLQAHFKNAFDGYSYMGQKDSLNQYDTDLLHSFVLSEFHDTEDFPQEFQGFLTNEWPELRAIVRAIELRIINELDTPFKQLYEADKMGYMMSCNYYPKPKAGLSEGQNNLRLSAHPDVSLLTTFPYGVSKGLSYFDDNKRFEVGEKKGPISFFGYFANFFSNGAIEPLEHQVESPKDFDIERFSFALFSIPKPDSTFTIGDREITGKDYYMQYLSLF